MIHYCKTMYCCRMTLRVHLPHRERFRNALHYQKWTDPRWMKPQKGQTVSVLHSREPLDARQDQREDEYDLNKSRIAPYKHAWKAHRSTVYWCNVKLAQRKGLQFYQTRSLAISLSSTLPTI